MAVEDEHQCWWRLPLDLDAHADQLGVRDMVPAKRARHERERLANCLALVAKGRAHAVSEGGMVTYALVRTSEVIGQFDAQVVFGNDQGRPAV